MKAKLWRIASTFAFLSPLILAPAYGREKTREPAKEAAPAPTATPPRSWNRVRLIC